jgi:molybdopterin molybdotransferase
MISVEEALARVLEQAVAHAPQTVALGDALGCVLAEDVASDVDTPPHDKSIVDGYAVVSADLADGSATLDVLEEVTAGAVPSVPVERGRTTRLMTGAPLPPGADAVIKVEESELQAGGGPLGRVLLRGGPVKPGQNIMRRASSARVGQIVAPRGTLVRPVEIGILAEVGRSRVAVTGRPSVAVVATGNELVPAERVPGPAQIRNSNGPMMAAAAASAGAVASDLGIARDEPGALRDAIERGLTHDVLLLSGGVSAGVLDLVPGVLKELGVEQVFHKVRIKPGKPLWFGVAQREGRGVLVFGLPGNPVSTLVCFELFVRPALLKIAGRQQFLPRWRKARLTAACKQQAERPIYHPAVVVEQGDERQVTPLDWRGSGDLRTLVEANALMLLPAVERIAQPGETVEVLEL